MAQVSSGDLGANLLVPTAVCPILPSHSRGSLPCLQHQPLVLDAMVVASMIGPVDPHL